MTESEMKESVKLFYSKDEIQYITYLNSNESCAVNPAKDFDETEYSLYLQFATQEELEGNYCSSQTYYKIDQYMNPIPEDCEPTVSLVEEDECEMKIIIDYIDKMKDT